METKTPWAADSTTLVTRLEPKEYVWLTDVAKHIASVEIDGEDVVAAPENVVRCLQDEPQDMYEDGMSPEDYAKQALLEYGVISNAEL